MNRWLKKFRQYRFNLPPSESPTHFNLARYLKAQGWTPTRYNWLANFSEKNFAFDSVAAKTLEYKHLLAKLITQYCPEVMPETYYINDANWSAVLSHVADQHYIEDNRLLDQVEDLAWILKPALLNNGQQIKIFKKLSEIEQHYLSSNRLGGDHVLQRYLTRPHLLKENKYSIRMFVVVTNYAGVYLYPQGYFNVGLYPYQRGDFTDLRGHLTNEHLKEHEANVVQIPTQQLDDLFSPIYQQIKTLINATMSALQQWRPHAFICKKQRTLAILGFDFIVDVDQRVWLLEANHGACFPESDEHPLQQQLYYNFWQAFITSFVSPIAKRQSIKQIDYAFFELI